MINSKLKLIQRFKALTCMLKYIIHCRLTTTLLRTYTISQSIQTYYVYKRCNIVKCLVCLFSNVFILIFHDLQNIVQNFFELGHCMLIYLYVMHYSCFMSGLKMICIRIKIFSFLEFIITQFTLLLIFLFHIIKT